MIKARIAFATAGVLLAAAAFASDPALAQQKLVLKASDVHAAGYPTVVAVENIGKKLEKATNGRLSVQMYPSMQLGGEKEAIEQAQVGAIAFARVSVGALGPVIDELNVFNLPYVFRNTAHMQKVIDGKIGQDLLDKVTNSGKGLVGLAYWENGFRNLTNSKRPVQKMEDLDGIKLRVMQNNVFLESFKTLGANAVPLPFSELFTALETHTVDGQENPYNTIVSSKFYEVQKYLTVTNHVYSPWIVLVSKKYWDTLSPAEQKVLRDAAKKSRDFERQDTREEANKALADLKAKGMQINELPAAEVGRMREKLAAVNAGIAAEVGQGLWQDVQGAVAQARGQ